MSDTGGNSLTKWRADVRAALGLLTRLPVGSEEGADRGRATRAYPIVGAAIGLLGGVVFAAASSVMSPLLAALLALAAMVWAGGALHEDGLADLADGFGGGVDAQAKLDIMRDSRIGTYGVLALVLSVAIRAVALAEISAPAAGLLALIAVAAVSRAFLPAIMLTFDPARADGMGAGVGRPPQGAVIAAAAIGAGIALVCLGVDGAIPALFVGALAATAIALLARRQIGGFTGDVLGAAQQVAEAAMLVTLVALS